VTFFVTRGLGDTLSPTAGLGPSSTADLEPSFGGVLEASGSSDLLTAAGLDPQLAVELAEDALSILASLDLLVPLASASASLEGWLSDEEETDSGRVDRSESGPRLDFFGSSDDLDVTE